MNYRPRNSMKQDKHTIHLKAVVAIPKDYQFLLPISKSLLNRQLILQSIRDLHEPLPGDDLPEDVRILDAMLRYGGPVWDAGEGGTTFRFLAAYLGLSGKKGTLTASGSMKSRPIGPLVDALIKLGVRVDYLEKTGFPPLEFLGDFTLKTTQLNVDTHQSSQFLTALLLSAPLLPKPVTFITGEAVTSRPYLTMTLRVLEFRGIPLDIDGNRITVGGQLPNKVPLNMEADWTAASYAYAHMACMPAGTSFALPGLRFSGLQGDEIIADYMKVFGVVTEVTGDQIRITRQTATLPVNPHWNLQDHPDLAQTLVVLCAFYGITGHFSGLHTLAIKETDRTRALQIELAKTGVVFKPAEPGSDTWIVEGQSTMPSEPFDTWGDHRMAMSLSLLAQKFPIVIRHPEVVSKSFPGYWRNLSAMGMIEEGG
jgi:3-phosphoshikimate 1-carboxyvinyltransferase